MSGGYRSFYMGFAAYDVRPITFVTIYPDGTMSLGSAEALTNGRVEISDWTVMGSVISAAVLMIPERRTR